MRDENVIADDNADSDCVEITKQVMCLVEIRLLFYLLLYARI